MNAISQVVVAGDIASVERKSNVGKNSDDVAEFYLAGCGLRISAWGKRAADVPDSGRVVVAGYLNTRTYEWEGKDRTSVDIRAMTITPLDAVDSEEPF